MTMRISKDPFIKSLSKKLQSNNPGLMTQLLYYIYISCMFYYYVYMIIQCYK
jgi:hypothetical protein